MTPVLQVVARCSYYEPHKVCRGRYEATYAGAFQFDAERKGYVCWDLPVPHAGQPALLEGCPYCFEELPSSEVKREQGLFPRGEMDVYEDEEGG